MAFIVPTSEEMILVGKKLSNNLSANDLVLLKGELGAGKTTLAKGIISSLSAVPVQDIQSPTFGYVHSYETPSFPLFHFDFYRLEDEEMFWDLGLDAYLDSEGLCLIEWPEKVPFLVSWKQRRMIEIKVDYTPSLGRMVAIEETL